MANIHEIISEVEKFDSELANQLRKFVRDTTVWFLRKICRMRSGCIPSAPVKMTS